jgi:uncharacterized protein YbbC (DUF1343 family)
MYAGQLCHGVNILIIDRNIVDTPELGLEIASALHRLYGQQYQMNKIDRLLVNRSVLAALSQQQDPQSIEEDWQKSLEDFKARRNAYLLY